MKYFSTVVIYLLCFVTIVDGQTFQPAVHPVVNTVYVEEGCTALLPCNISHLGTKAVIWRKSTEPYPLTINEYVFTTDTRVQMRHTRGTMFTLMIQNTHKSDEGTYECQISSTQQSLRQTFTLHVEDAILSDNN